MRRAAIQVLRSARRPLLRSVYRSRNTTFYAHNHGLNFRNGGFRRDRGPHPQLLLSSMFFRNFSVALLSTVVASGAYFTFRGGPFKGADGNLSVTTSPLSGAAQQTRGLSSSNIYSADSTGFPTVEGAQTTRRALVVDQGELYTGTIKGDGPLSKTTDDYGRKVLEIMIPEQATQRIRRNEESYLVGRGKGVVRYDVVQLASNDPIEDDHAEKIIEVPQSITPLTDGTSSNDWMFWGVYDGHSGWTTSAKLRQALISFVARELNTTYSSALKQPQTSQSALLPSPSSIDAAIKRGFLALDTSIVQHSVTEVLKTQSKPRAASLLAPALAGSCALLSFYDSSSKILRVACTGDSRAILGRRSTTSPTKWTVLPLSVDQTGGNEDEAARLRAEHPGEPGVVRNGRVLGGLEPSRAFGDATYKWSQEIQERMKREFFGRTSNTQIKTPPYVTAEPVVTTTKVYPDKGDFVVMATDGLWEMLTNEEVVGLVGQWLEKHPEAQRASSGKSNGMPGAVDGAVVASTGDPAADSWLRSWFSSSQKHPADLPVQQLEDQSRDQSGQRAPMRQKQWGLSPSTSSASGVLSSDRYVVEDKNAATHLIRNALGGGDRDMVCSLLTLPSPYSRRYRYAKLFYYARITVSGCWKFLYPTNRFHW